MNRYCTKNNITMSRVIPDKTYFHESVEAMFFSYSFFKEMST